MVRFPHRKGNFPYYEDVPNNKKMDYNSPKAARELHGEFAKSGNVIEFKKKA